MPAFVDLFHLFSLCFTFTFSVLSPVVYLKYQIIDIIIIVQNQNQKRITEFTIHLNYYLSGFSDLTHTHTLSLSHPINFFFFVYFWLLCFDWYFFFFFFIIILVNGCREMAHILLHGTLHVTVYEVDKLHSDGGPKIFRKVLLFCHPFSLSIFYNLINLDLTQYLISVF